MRSIFQIKANVPGLSAYNSNIPHFSHVIKVDYL